jgi:ATP-dependent RNA helicase DDX23/PRP28
MTVAGAIMTLKTFAQTIEREKGIPGNMMDEAHDVSIFPLVSECILTVTDDEKRRDTRNNDDRNPRSIPTGPRADRNRGPSQLTSRSGDMGPPSAPSKGQKQQDSSNANGAADDGTSMTSSELSAIRSRYLGVDKKKRPVRKISDRKFVFDWAEQDDTFAMDSPSAVGSQRQGAAVMFGRGHLAGMENNAAPHLPRPTAVSDAANSMVLDSSSKKKVPLDERHWSEKPLEEMRDRDWRIFREDFSISARGPLRFITATTHI